ncbi:MAG: hypothetical protein U1E62_08210 [Alsobacter sp.]
MILTSRMPRPFRRSWAILLATLASVTASTAIAQEQVTLLAGESGWIADNAGGLVTLRTSLRQRGTPEAEAGRLLFFCTTTEDRVLFDPVTAGGIRSTEPAMTGTATMVRLADKGGITEGRPILSSLRVFPNRSFELSDLPTGEQHVARALVGEAAEGAKRVRLVLNGVPKNQSFERARSVIVEIRMTKADRPSLEMFEQSCRLLSVRR